MPASRRLRHGVIAAGVFVVIALMFLAERTGRLRRFLSEWEYRFRDVLTMTGRFNRPDKHLVFLGIDSTSVSLSSLDLQTLFADVPAGSPERRALELMAEGWPWSREVYALLVERLFQAGARAVALDLLFLRPATGDEALRASFKQHPGRVIVGSNFVSETIGPGQRAWSLDMPVPEVVANPVPQNPGIGYVNFWADGDGIVRRAQYRASLDQLQSAPPPYAKNASASLALRAAAAFDVAEIAQPFQQTLFRYSGPPGTFPVIPLYQVFVPLYWQRNLGNGAALRDKLVLIGPFGNWSHDEHPTPFGQMSGPELQLNSINALLHGAFMRELPPITGYFLIALGAVASWILTMCIPRMWLRLATYLLCGTAYLLGVKLLFDHAGVVLLAISPVTTFVVTGLGSFIYDYTHETLEKLRIRRTLESYVSRDVVREVLDNPESYLRALGGQRAQVALIVTDLRGFTTMAERIESSQLVTQLNEYLSLMVEDIFACRGSVDKFIGDAILAVWGHVNSDGPEADTRHAVEAALRMKETLTRLNGDWQQRGLPLFQMGCGLNFGEVVFGNIGSTRKMEPTVIGDAVNVTARLEGLTKDYGRDLLLGEAAAEHVRDSYHLQLVDRVVLKGKTQPLKIYSVIAPAHASLDSATSDYLKTYESAQAKYLAGAFEKAAVEFQTCLQQRPDDTLSGVYLRRCRTSIETPPTEEWTGVYVAEHK